MSHIIPSLQNHTEGNCKMLWNRQYIIKSYMRSSLWLVPFFAVLAYMVVNRIIYNIGKWLLLTGRIDETTAFLGVSMTGARSLLETVITLNLSFLVFTFGSLLVAIQVAGGQSRHGSSRQRCCGTTQSGSPSAISFSPYCSH